MLPPLEGRTSVELYHRDDFYGAQGAPPVTLVDTQAVP
jgi:hypothetical protein